MKKCIVLNDTYYDFHHGCETVMKNIFKILKDRNIEVIATNPVGKDWLENKDLLNKLSECDFILVNGEGTIHHSKKRAKDLVKIAPYVKEKFNIPVFLINSTYQENNEEISNDTKYFDKVYVRESMSQQELSLSNISSTVVPDLTFYSTYSLDEKVASNRIGATDSVNDKVSSTLYELCMKNNYSYLPALTKPNTNRKDFLSYSRTLKFTIRKFIRTLQRDFLRRYDILLNGYKFYINDYDKYVQTISDLNFLIVGRYHSLCFALKTLTPFIAIESNSHKIESMLHDIGLENKCIKLEELSKIELKDFTEDEKKLIIKYVENAPIKIEKMFDEIINIVEKKND